MKRKVLFSMMVCCLLAPAAFADDDGKKEAKAPATRKVIVKVEGGEKEAKDGKKRVQVQVLELGGGEKKLSAELRKQIEEKVKKAAKGSSITIFSKGFKIGSDGKLQEIDLNIEAGDLNLGGALKGLPKEIRVQVEAAMKGINLKQGGKGAVGKAVIIGPDGKRQEIDLDLAKGELKLGDALKGLPKGVQLRIEKAVVGAEHKHSDKASSGTAIIIGPDGKKKEIKLNISGGQLNLGASLKGLPQEVRKKVELAISGAKRAKHAHAEATVQNKAAGDKLDLILKRLERMEKQIQELRAKVKD
jgi:hypothetical protein